MQWGDVLVCVSLLGHTLSEDLFEDGVITKHVTMELVEPKVRELYEIFNDVVSNCAIACTHCLVHVALKGLLDMRVKLEDLFPGLDLN